MKAAAPRVFHFLVLHHGYHGTTQDLSYLSSLLQRSSKYIVLEPRVNEGLRTDQGVLLCAERLTEYLVKAVDAAVAEESGCRSDGCPTVQTRVAAAVRSTTGSSSDSTTSTTPTATYSAEVHLSFVTHSMGGLIVRAMLPALSAALAAKYTAVHWDTICTVAAPHAGVRQMPSTLRSRAGDWAGWLFRSTGLADMYLRSDLLGGLLLEERYLAAWRRFDRRVLVAAVNDNTVMLYSGVFAVPPADLALLELRSDAVGEVAEEAATAVAADGLRGALLPPASYVRADLQAQLARQAPPSAAAPSRGTHEPSSPLTPPLAQTPPPHPLPYKADATSSPGLRTYHGGGTLLPHLWPPRILPVERAIADRIVGAVGPFEVYLVDFRPRPVSPSSSTSPAASGGKEGVRATSAPHPHPHLSHPKYRFGAYEAPHRAILCKSPCHHPDLFGFVSEFIADGLFGVAAVEGEEERHQQW